jgi:hypothetical protein
MKLIFTHDYLGRETGMKQYRKGDTGDFPVAQALELIRMERAEEVVTPVEEEKQPHRARRVKKEVTDD